MNVQFESPNFNTSTLGKVVVMIAPLLAYSYSTLTPQGYQYSLPNSTIIPVQTQNTSGIELFKEDQTIFYKLKHFSEKLLSETSDVPPEFNAFFQENFWDLLA